MSRKQTLQTNLLGETVQYSEFVDGKLKDMGLAEIRSVFLDKDGNPKYTLATQGGKLVEVYSTSFRVVRPVRSVSEGG